VRRCAVNSFFVATNPFPAAPTGKAIVATTLKKKPANISADVSPEYLSTLCWLTPRQSCWYLQIGRSSLDKLIAAGDIPVSRPSARIVRINRQALDAWLSQTASAE
jgi:excisionase family DNA binding protein